MLFIVKCFWLMLPIGIANITPVIVKNYFTWLARPIDFNCKIGEKSLFGTHKTWRGLIFGTIMGGLFFIIQKHYYITGATSGISLIDYGKAPDYLGFLIGLGAIGGDLIKSFFKRRFHIKSGKSWFPFDQLDYIIGGLLVASIYFSLSYLTWLVTLCLGLVLHILFNYLGYYIGFKRKKW